MKTGFFKILLCISVALPILVSAQERDMFRVEKISVNSRQYNEMTPVLFGDGIVFCSDRRLSGLTNNVTFEDDHIYNIYYAAREDTLEWGRARIFSKDLKSLFTEGPFCFSPDGNQIYFTSEMEKGKKALRPGFKNTRGIFIADKSGEGWTNIRQFKHNDPLWNVGHPFISNDGRYLFFASDIPGGQGGSDIFLCEWVNNAWSDPVNLGPEVNSPAAELFPYYSPNGELFFASDRNGGIGGLDLYTSKLAYGNWREASLLPEPINSGSDDFALYKEAGTQDGFFTSNRERTDDIYRFTSLIIRKNNCDSLEIEEFCYEFKDDNAFKFDTTSFIWEWDFGDGTKTRGRKVDHCFEKAGTYLVKLNLIDTISGKVEKNAEEYLLPIERMEQAFINSPDTCFTEEDIGFDASFSNLPGWDIAEYYWNFDDGTIDTGLKVDKKFIEEGMYNVQLIISTYPDAEGNVREKCVSKYVVVQRR